jgi:hypothetical protein
VDSDSQSTAESSERNIPSQAEAMAAVAAARSAPAIVVASDESISLPFGGTWEYQARTVQSPTPAACLENLGSSQACRALHLGGEDAQILAYGGAPIPVVAVWSTGDHESVTALLSDGSTQTAEFVATDVGAFAAFPFSARNPPTTLFASSPVLGDVDLGLSEFVGDDPEKSVEGANY